jgi:FtsP/CotA-like multicopper oxidase with cupredoxin domain
MKKLICLLAISATCLAAPTILEVKNKIIQVNGKSVTLATIEQPDGTWGYYAKSGEKFDVIVKNELAESTVIHWHGLILPNDQDGVSGVTQVRTIAPGASEHYQFQLVQSGTYWMHSHEGMQEQVGVEAPLIILTPQDQKYQQIPIMFQDFSFKTPEQIMAGLGTPEAAESGSHNMHAVHSSMAMDNMESMDMSAMSMDDMAMPAMDLNDVHYDAFLTNYHSDEKPQITQVKAGQSVKLRFINGAGATNFWINLGKLQGKLVAVDGQVVKPLVGNKFQIALGQRVDVLVTIPKAGGTFPILGQVEGLKDQTGIILTSEATPKLAQIESQAAVSAPALDYSQELQLHSLQKLTASKNKITLNLKITGNMTTYKWQLNDQSWPNIMPLQAKQGDLVTLVFDNQSMMAHPMHLHGYDFKIVNIDGKVLNGALRDTVLVLPHSKVTVQFVADHPGKWMLHCHMMYHMDAGMMTYLDVK